MFALVDRTSPGTFTNIELERLVWCLRYQALYHFNRSPWVEHGYVGASDGIVLATAGVIPAGAWPMELLDNSDQPGALGYHEDLAYDNKSAPGRPQKSSGRSSRGITLHPATGVPVPLAKVFAKTCREDGVAVSEVCSHEMLESLVDPSVVDEAHIRKAPGPDNDFYIVEVGDPVQERPYDVGSPEGRPCNVPEAIMADFAYPAWWSLGQTRPATAFCSDDEAWSDRKPAQENLQPFTLAPGGYISREPENAEGQWEQLFGSKHGSSSV